MCLGVFRIQIYNLDSQLVIVIVWNKQLYLGKFFIECFSMK